MIQQKRKEREREKRLRSVPVGRAAARCVGGTEDLRDSLRECFSMSLVPPPSTSLHFFLSFAPPLSPRAHESRRREKASLSGVLASSPSLSLSLSVSSRDSKSNSGLPSNDTMVLPPSPPLVEADVDAVLAGVADLMQGNVSATRFCSRPCARRYLNARQGSVSRAIKAMRYVVCWVCGL